VTVAVSEALKGDAGGRLTVAVPGGVDASRRIPVAMIWPAAPPSPSADSTAYRSTFGVRNTDTVCLDPRKHFSVNQLRTA